MKNTITLKTVLLLLALSISAYSQKEKSNKNEEKVQDTLQKKQDTLIETLGFATGNELKKGAVNNYLFDIQDSGRNFNAKMLNVLFASEVSGYLNDSNDLTLQKAYAVLSTEDNTLFLGGSFDFRCEGKTEKLTHLMTLGIKAGIDDNFTVLSKNSEIQGNIGFNLKYTWIGRGIINFFEPSMAKRYREEVLKPKFQKKVDKYVDEELPTGLKVASLKDDASVVRLRKKLLKRKAKDIYEEFADEEIKFLKEEKVYSRLWDHWVTTEAFIPVTQTQYTINTEIATTDLDTQNFMPWNLKLGYTSFWKWSSGYSVYVNGLFSVFNNNNILTEDLQKFSFPITSPQNESFVSSTKTIYNGNYENFSTTNIKGEAVFFFCKSIGVSAALEQNFGDYDVMNWKLGMPFSLRDKDGKPTVNFEVQWKEINTSTSANHIIGLSIGYSFGKFIQ